MENVTKNDQIENEAFIDEILGWCLPELNPLSTTPIESPRVLRYVDAENRRIFELTRKGLTQVTVSASDLENRTNPLQSAEMSSEIIQIDVVAPIGASDRVHRRSEHLPDDLAQAH